MSAHVHVGITFIFSCQQKPYTFLGDCGDCGGEDDLLRLLT